jgi:molybdopterin molybdotransferase
MNAGVDHRVAAHFEREMFGAGPVPRRPGRLAVPLGGNGPREHYMRAVLARDGDGWSVKAFDDQDSSRLALLAAANALIVRPIGAPGAAAGEPVPVIRQGD